MLGFPSAVSTAFLFFVYVLYFVESDIIIKGEKDASYFDVLRYYYQNV